MSRFVADVGDIKINSVRKKNTTNRGDIQVRRAIETPELEDKKRKIRSERFFENDAANAFEIVEESEKEGKEGDVDSR